MAKNDALEKELFDTNSTNSGNNSTSGTFNNRIDSYEKTLDNLIKDLIKKIVNIEGNERCCDCNNPDPDWLVTNLGILVCIECCGIHRLVFRY